MGYHVLQWIIIYYSGLSCIILGYHVLYWDYKNKVTRGMQPKKLFSLEVNQDGLKQYLDEIIERVNQNEETLDSQNNLIHKKVD